MIFGTSLNLHNDISIHIYNIVYIIILLSTILVIFLLGNSLFINTLREIRRKRITIESLFAITLLGSFIASLESYINGYGYIYFEVVPILLIIYNIGNLLVSRIRYTTIKRASLWNNQLNQAHKVIADNKTIDVPVDTIQENDIIQTNPGEAIPVDGKIIEGSAYIYSGYVRGEPFPVARNVGDSVIAGEIVYDAVIRIQAKSKGTNRQIDNIIDIINKTNNKPGSIRYISDKLSQLFVPFIIMVSIITFFYWLILKEDKWYNALYHSMSVLLVACPCVIGIAVPLIQWISVNKLAENGIILRSGDIIERLAKIDCIIFDKTGTLTDIENYSIKYKSFADNTLLEYILCAIYYIEKNIKHPIAQIISQTIDKCDKYTIYFSEIKQIPGCGIEAKLIVQNMAMTLHIGTEDWIKKIIDQEELVILYQESSKSKSIYVLCNYQLSMIIEYREKLINYARETFVELSKLGLQTIVMTGDNHPHLENLLVHNIYSGLSPLEKYQRLKELKDKNNNIMYIGDGINDASALASADVAIALASGVDLAVQASDAILYNKDLRVIPWAIAFSRATMHAIRRNLSRALIYNIIGVGLAASGYLHPVVAILLMTLSSICLILSATRIKYNDNCNQVVTTPTVSLSKDFYQYLSFIHFISFSLQGLLIYILIDGNMHNYIYILTISIYIILGFLISYLWNIWIQIPHYLDMAIGMLTLGNLGMILGSWWDKYIYNIDHLHYQNDTLSANIFSGMWLGMLLFSNIAMFFMNRRIISNRIHKISMLFGGNIGMISSMYLLSYYYNFTHIDILHYLIMSIGMIIGMLIGTYLMEKILSIIIEVFRYYLSNV
jgi:heavy metal translocating P-type ATPase